MRTTLALLAALATPTAAQLGTPSPPHDPILPPTAQVWTVGPGASDDFTKIQAAVDTALDGDLILVRPGHVLSPVTVDAKALTIVAEEPVPPSNYLYVYGTWVVQNLGPQQSFSLFGFRIYPGSGTGQTALVLRFNQGPVRVSGSMFLGDAGQDYLEEGDPGIYVAQCADVTFVDCISRGGQGFDNEKGSCFFPTNGGPGLRVRNSSVRLFGGSIQGGDGGDDDGVFICQGYGADGGPGLDDIDASVYASGCSLLGGYAGYGSDGEGLLGPSAVFGTPQASLTLLGAPAPDGVPPGAVVLGPTARRLEAPAPTSSGTTPLTIHGEPGELVLLRFGLSASGPILQWKGPAGSGRTVALGTIGPSGQLDAQVPPPPLFGELGAAHVLEALVVGPLGTLSAGSAPWIVLDPGL